MKKIRRQVMAPRVLVSVDYDTLELRALGQVCLWLFGQSRLAETINAGRDPHLDFAAQLLCIPYEEAEARKKDPVVKNARDLGKVGNFGIPGGLGPDALIDFARTGYKVTLDYPTAKNLKDNWLNAFPEMRHYFRHVNDRLNGRDYGTLTQFVSNRVRGNVHYCAWCNSYFQGLAADGAKNALFNVLEECFVDMGTALFGARPVAFIHDEIVAELPEETAHEAAERLAVVMCESMAEYIPDVKITASPALMTRWWKGAAAAFDDNDRLIPWEPDAVYDSNGRLIPGACKAKAS